LVRNRDAKWLLFIDVLKVIEKGRVLDDPIAILNVIFRSDIAKEHEYILLQGDQLWQTFTIL
jgi:hypothetical protein